MEVTTVRPYANNLHLSPASYRNHANTSLLNFYDLQCCMFFQMPSQQFLSTEGTPVLNSGNK